MPLNPVAPYSRPVVTAGLQARRRLRTAELATNAHCAKNARKNAKSLPSSGQAFCAEIKYQTTAYTLNEEPHPQVDFTWGFSNLKPAASSVST